MRHVPILTFSNKRGDEWSARKNFFDPSKLTFYTPSISSTKATLISPFTTISQKLTNHQTLQYSLNTKSVYVVLLEVVIACLPFRADGGNDEIKV